MKQYRVYTDSDAVILPAESPADAIERYRANCREHRLQEIRLAQEHVEFLKNQHAWHDEHPVEYSAVEFP